MTGDEQIANDFISVSGIYAKVEIHEWFSISSFYTFKKKSVILITDFFILKAFYFCIFPVIY
jgi:hypothetical protein